ncbi:biopolymer transport protein ExbB [Roseimicrobium gellanilyticum]|uniref:Biopolymer transport protein ExbB n=1 Tax=Roseimicrobium gellanilyticum TaxID=748857 RepID=A0A366HBX0_9BACT|nr:MotA/TolQ/ExbB proton channel family protein [Roseimicrobium gellanilyticum]RBP39023.1 biopolymer transport protein ExbB [Roseimicrobium gellanilyticum]
MLDLISKGGALVWVLLGCFGLALAIFAERISYYHRAGMNVGEFLAGLASLIRRKNYAEALQECVATRVPAGRVLHAALLRHHSTREQLKDIVQEAGQLEVPRLERYLSVLHGIAHATPLIGLLGTILGLMNTFTRLNNENGYATPAEVANGVFLALITSALGLVVAIPSYLFYSFLAAKARHLMHDLERAGIEIVNILEDNREPAHAATTGGAQIVEFRKTDSGSALKRG